MPSRRRPINKVTVTLAANEIIRMSMGGSGYLVDTLTGNVSLSLDDIQFTDVDEGDKYRMDPGERFNQIVIQETAGAAASIVLKIFDGDADNVKFSGNVTVTSGVNSGDTCETPVKVNVTTTKTELVAAAATRNATGLYNNGSVTVWIGDDNVDATIQRGIPLAPSEYKVFPTGAELNGRTASSNADVSIMEFKD